MYKNSKTNNNFIKPVMSKSFNKIADVVHAYQEWQQPKRKTTFKKYHNGTVNLLYKNHYSNGGVDSDLNPNKEPESIVKAREKAANLKSKRNHIVYLVKFVGKHDTFLKIGLTSRTIEERFIADRNRFKTIVIGKSPKLNYQAAFALEQALLNLFRSNRKRPNEILYSGGNTECFTYSSKLVSEALALIIRT